MSQVCSIFVLIIKGNSHFLEDFCCFLPHFLDDFFENLAHFLEEFCGNVYFDMSCHAAIKTPGSGLLRGGGEGECYAEPQAMRAWASISSAVSSISVGGVSMLLLVRPFVVSLSGLPRRVAG